jgi:hypothetical protein
MLGQKNRTDGNPPALATHRIVSSSGLGTKHGVEPFSLLDSTRVPKYSHRNLKQAPKQ